MGQIVKVKGVPTPEQQEKLDEALNRREEIDYQCFLKPLRLLPFVDVRELEAKKLVEEAEELIRERDQANHDFVAALTGRG